MNGNSDRPFLYSCDASNLDNWLQHYVATTVDYRYPMQGYSNVWLTLAPNATKWIFDSTNGDVVNFTKSAGYVQFDQIGTANDPLLFQGWAGFLYQAYSGAPLFQITSNQLNWGGSSTFQGGMTVNGAAVFNSDARVNGVLYENGDSSSFANTPYYFMYDSAAAAAARNWAISSGNYGSVDYGWLSFWVSNAKDGQPTYAHSTAVMNLHSNLVQVPGNLEVGKLATFGSGLGSTAVNADTLTSTGWTNTAAVTMNVYLDTATNLTLFDSSGNVEFAGKDVWMISQFRVQPGGKITGTDISGTVHAW